MNNIMVVVPLIVFCAVGIIGCGINQWRLNRKPLPPIPSGRIIRATMTKDEHEVYREWM